MKIQLPETFICTNRSKNASAYVKNGVLYVKGYISFEELIYTITYVVSGISTNIFGILRIGMIKFKQ